MVRGGLPLRGGGLPRAGAQLARPGLQLLDLSPQGVPSSGFLHLIVGHDDFQIIRGAEALTEYRFNTRVARHTFCAMCGIHPFYVPRSHPDQIDVNVRTLVQEAFERFTVEPFDGANWEANIDSIR